MSVQRRWLSLSLAALSIMAFELGCASTRDRTATPDPPSGRSNDSKRTRVVESPLAADADPVKARMPLNKIPDAPDKPVAASNLTPLSDRAAKQLATANDLIKDQRYTEAAIELERALRFEPNHPDIQRALAALHWQAGNLERARIHAGKAIEGDPDQAMPHYILAQCAMRSSDIPVAVKEFRTALLCSDAKPDSEVTLLTHYNLAEALASLGYFEAALQEYSRFEQSANSLKSKTLSAEASAAVQSAGTTGGESKAKVLEKLGRVAEAADALAPTVATHPEDTARLKHYADLLMRANRYDDALKAVRSIPSDDPEVVDLSYRIYDAAGRLNELVGDLRHRMESRPDEQRLAMSLADVLLKMKQPQEADEVMRSFLSKHPDSEEIRAKLLNSLIQQANWSVATTMISEGVSHQPESAGKIEQAFLDAIRKDQAAQLLKTVKPDASNFAQMYLLGRIATVAGQPKDAEANLSASITLKSDFAAARAALAQLLVDQYRYDDAMRAAATDDDTMNSTAWLEQIRGIIFERLDKLDQAEAHLRRATVLNHADAKSMLLLAQIYRRSNRVLQAQRQLRVLLDEDRKNEAAHELLALTYVNEKKRDAAVEEIEELRRLSTNPCTIARCNAFLDPQLNSNPEARREALMKALESGPPDAQTWLAVADTYDDDQPQEQLNAYQKALQLDPDNEDAAFGVMRSEEGLLHFEDAVAQLSELLQRRPNRQSWRHALIRLNWVLNDFNRALAIATEQEAHADPGSTMQSDFREAIIGTLTQAGDLKQAIAQLKKWIDESADDKDQGLRYALMDAYLADEQPTKAVEAAEELYKRNPNDEKVRRYLMASLQEAKRYDRGTQYALEWLEEDPDNDQLHWFLITSQASAGRSDEAIDLARRRILQTSRRELYQDLIANRLTIDKRYDECISYLESLADEATSLLRIVGENGRRPMDKPSDDEVLRRPNEPWTPDRLQDRILYLRHRLAIELIAVKRFRDAEESLTEWIQNVNNPDQRSRFLVDLSTCYREQGNDEKSTEALEQAHTVASGGSSESITLGNDLAYLWIDRGIKLDQAESLIKFAVGRVPLQAAFLDTYGWLLYKRGSFEESKKWLLRGFNGFRDRQPLRGKDPVIQDHLGDCLWRLNDAAGAIEHWTEAVRLAEERKSADLINDDEKRVREVTPKKIEAAKNGGEVPAAPVASGEETSKRRNVEKSK